VANYRGLKEDERVSYWMSQVMYAKDLMRPWFDACQVLVDQYDNEASSERERIVEGESSEAHVSRVKSNMVFGWIDQCIANMLDREPVFRVVPENREAVPHVDRIGAISNYMYKRTGQLRTDERCTLDAFLMPYGVCKIGYTVDFDARMQELWQPDTDLVVDDPNDENLFLANGTPTLVTEEQDHKTHIAVHEAELLAAIGPEPGGYLAGHVETHRAFQDRPAPDINTAVRNESPFGVRWRPDMFFMDWRAQEGLNDARWIAFEWELPIEEVKANPLYRNTADLRPSARADGAPDRPENLEEDSFDIVRGFEVWVRNFPVGRGHFKNMLLTVAEGHDKFLREEDEWPYMFIDDFPAEILSFQQAVRTWFNKPSILLAGGDSIQALQNEILDSFLYVARKQKNIWLYDPSFVDEGLLTNILESPDSTMFPVKGLADREHTGRIVQAIPFQAVGSEKGELLGLSQQVFDRAAGTPTPVPRTQPDTATEASIIDRRNTARENRRSSLVSEFQVRKAYKFWNLLAQYQPRQLDLIDPRAGEAVQVTAEMATGRYRFTIDISSQTAALAVERSQLMDLLNLFAGLTPLFIETFGLPPNLPELARRLLVRGFSEKAAEEILPILSEDYMAQVKERIGAMEQQRQMMQQGGGEEAAAAGLGAQEGPAQEAVQRGRTVGQGIGAAHPQQFNRDTPAAGQRQGESMHM
jgi:hypothetical protein